MRDRTHFRPSCSRLCCCIVLVVVAHVNIIISVSLVVQYPSCHAFARPILSRRSRILPSRAHIKQDKDGGGGADSDEQKEIARQRLRFIEIGRQQLAHCFDFPLDDWQLHAGGAICEGFHVIVCAPTGAGKTVVGEMALIHAHERNRLRGIYTTPLKALSNQKFADLIQMFGRSAVGLSTGDVSINKKSARVTVMTTEVYRNMAWRDDSTELDDTAVVVLDEFHYMGYPGRGGVWEESVITSPPHVQLIALSATLPNAENLSRWMEFVTEKTCVLVQVSQQRPVPLRYLFATKEGMYPLFRDADAGPGAPKGLLGLRGDGEAPNKGKKTGFGSETQKAEEKIPRGLQVNPALRAAAEKRLQRVDRALERHKAQAYLGAGSRHGEDDDELAWFRKNRGRSSTPPSRMSSREERKERERLLRKELRRSVPSLPALVNRLDQKLLLPAIFFIFSRAGCEEAARTLYETMKGPRDPSRLSRQEVEEFRELSEGDSPNRKTRQRGRQRGGLLEDSNGRTFRSSNSFISEDVLMSLFEPSEPLQDDSFDEYSPLSSENWEFYSSAGLLDYKQVKEVAARAARFNEENPEIAFEEDLVEQFLFGVGSHHAGMLPAHKSFVEVLYRNQLMKVVFATETLAAGINMPARTTVVCSLAKRGDGSSMNLLETSNLLQMAGRAGRRGMDTDGTCVIVATPFETHDDAAKILTDPVKPISSQFTPSYSLALNLIARGDGKLDVARQLVGKSFAKWEKRKVEESIAAIVGSHGDAVSEIRQASAQERFMSTLADVMQLQVDRKRAKFDIARLQTLLEIFNDRETLKKTSKSYLGALKVLELETTTLAYLEKELEAFRTIYAEDDLELFVGEDEQDVLDQIETQRRRTATTQKELNKHPFTVIAKIANQIMDEGASEGKVLLSLLGMARQGSEAPSNSLDLTPEELCQISKSAVVVQRKARKLANGKDIDAGSILEHSGQVDARDDSWEDFLSITRTLMVYGCLSTDKPFSHDIDLEARTCTITPAGTNVGMIGFENGLWVVVAIGGAFDVMSVSSRLDSFRESLEEDDIDWYGQETNKDIPKPQQEAEILVSQLQSLSASELAGYISSLTSDNSRTGGPSVVDLFKRLTPAQQRVVQSSLLAMERLMEIQKLYSVDESTRSCTLDVSNCEVVTAWASGCSWTEALQISGLPPGDLARTLSRVLDALRQLGNLPFTPIRKGDFTENTHASTSAGSTVPRGIHPDIRRLCREAAKGINRYPLKDTLAFESGEEDDFDKEGLGEKAVVADVR